jgi:hypothetical protein
MIWRATMPGPRLVPLWSKNWKRGFVRPFEHLQKEDQKYILQNPPPKMLHVCQESRAETLQQYSARHNLKLEVPVTPPSAGTLFVDLENDIVYFSQFRRVAFLRETQHLAIPCRYLEHEILREDPSYSGIMGNIHEFPRILDIAMVIHAGSSLRCSEMEFNAKRSSKVTLTTTMSSACKIQLSRLRAYFEEAKCNNAEWKVLEVSFKYRSRKGKVCCSFGLEDGCFEYTR